MTPVEYQKQVDKLVRMHDEICSDGNETYMLAALAGYMEAVTRMEENIRYYKGEFTDKERNVLAEAFRQAKAGRLALIECLQIRGRKGGKDE